MIHQNIRLVQTVTTAILQSLAKRKPRRSAGLLLTSTTGQNKIQMPYNSRLCLQGELLDEPAKLIVFLSTEERTSQPKGQYNESLNVDYKRLLCFIAFLS